MERILAPGQVDKFIMGVVNITPDSFSDGGDFFEPQIAIKHCLGILEEGADLIDIGAESTRPGAAPVPPDEEWQRLEPVLKALVEKNLGHRISVDSRNDETLLKALDCGAKWFNNISGLCQSTTLATIARDPETRYIAMHMRGDNPQTMQQHPLSGDAAITEVRQAFVRNKAALLEAGFSKERIFMDPGIGFGKTDNANLQLLSATAQFAKESQLLIGVSRKSFIGRLLNITDPKDRDAPSKMLEFSLWALGAKIIRTHDVKSLARLRDTEEGRC